MLIIPRNQDRRRCSISLICTGHPIQNRREKVKALKVAGAQEIFVEGKVLRRLITASSFSAKLAPKGHRIIVIFSATPVLKRGRHHQTHNPQNKIPEFQIQQSFLLFSEGRHQEEFLDVGVKRVDRGSTFEQTGTKGGQETKARRSTAKTFFSFSPFLLFFPFQFLLNWFVENILSRGHHR